MRELICLDLFDMDNLSDYGNCFGDFARLHGHLDLCLDLPSQSSDIIDDTILCGDDDTIDFDDFITCDESCLFCWAMTDNISDSERASRIDIDDHTDTDDIAIE